MQKHKIRKIIKDAGLKVKEPEWIQTLIEDLMSSDGQCGIYITRNLDPASYELQVSKVSSKKLDPNFTLFYFSDQNISDTCEHIKIPKHIKTVRAAKSYANKHWKNTVLNKMATILEAEKKGNNGRKK